MTQLLCRIVEDFEQIAAKKSSELAESDATTISKQLAEFALKTIFDVVKSDLRAWPGLGPDGLRGSGRILRQIC